MGDDGCAAGLHCDFATNACAAPVPDGATCGSDAWCVAGSACVFDGMGNTCRPVPSTAGTECEERCGGGLRCALPSGVCARGACTLVR